MSELERLRERIDFLVEENRQLKDLLASPKNAPPLEWGLSKTRTRIYTALATRKYTSFEQLLAAVYAGRGCTFDPTTLRCNIMHTKRALQAHGLTIKSQRGLGYSLATYAPPPAGAPGSPAGGPLAGASAAPRPRAPALS